MGAEGFRRFGERDGIFECPPPSSLSACNAAHDSNEWVDVPARALRSLIVVHTISQIIVQECKSTMRDALDCALRDLLESAMRDVRKGSMRRAVWCAMREDPMECRRGHFGFDVCRLNSSIITTTKATRLSGVDGKRLQLFGALSSTPSHLELELIR